MSQKNLFTKSALAAAVAIISSNVSAAGFQLNEFSSAGLGRSYSGEGAMADTAASASRNPALLMMYTRPELSFGAVFIDPDVDITGKSPSGASLDSKNIAPTAWVPNLHYVQPINDQFAVGASVTSNYGLATEFNDGYTAGAYGGKTDLTTVNLNLSGAYRLNQNFSFGLGFDAVYAKAKLERYAGESGAALGMPADTQISHLKGDEWGFGWNAGLLYEVDENNRYGLTYRSEVKVDFDGDYKSSIPSRFNPLQGRTGLPWGTDGNTIPGSLTLNLPEMWEISGYNKVAPQWAVHYSLAYTSWSQFQELKATGNNGQTLFEKHEGFKDAYRIALGTTYFYDDNWTFRTGIAFDDSPVPAQNRSISIPDQDRFWLSAGTSYAFNKDASVDVGISYMHGQKVTIKEGPYTFESVGKAWLYGANFNYRF
ncbi:long-chain fatty acid transporter FadL [Serratia proteamaculans]|jgi:long-chain fatty acid transport protein|uniref:Long-chain fatty acid transport protein n=1 Tax=Serratia proteamaculans TaxID=28151 RepID=A0A7U0N3T9_SERPR|nr:long-chain fatty acid transporter FadL [Serratia proteamaculans]KAB1499442.1 long-chain fatty acid transporter FadL [Serratia proteamaculans]MBI6180055.1 long-chain fatty acid transporter FadL [Serratia proteamaculans]MBO1504075.1 long-chain fatty acid transporter FadL [Serratia proteamaculans]MDW5510294.1 long-chain fatty acid transporter FadL [Serratia proteamaculans]QQX52026.1 long-chain fatty acid transporter FadL [Serratia proteamaculans]